MGCCRLIDGRDVLGELPWADRWNCPFEGAMNETFKHLHQLRSQTSPLIQTGLYATLGLTGATTTSIYDSDPQIVGHMASPLALRDDA